MSSRKHGLVSFSRRITSHSSAWARSACRLREADLRDVAAHEREVGDRLAERRGGAVVDPPGVLVVAVDVLAHQLAQAVAGREPEAVFALDKAQRQVVELGGVERDAAVDHHERLRRRLEQAVGLDVGERQACRGERVRRMERVALRSPSGLKIRGQVVGFGPVTDDEVGEALEVVERQPGGLRRMMFHRP